MNMFSESAGLLCSVKGNKYYVLNGQWEGIRDEDRFTITATGTVLTITDWLEVDPSQWSLEKQYQWYYKR